MTPVHPSPHPKECHGLSRPAPRQADPSLPISYAADSSSIDIVRLTDGVYDLLYHTSYAERCHRDGQNACSAWLHGQMDLLGVGPSQHERLIILAKFRNGDRSPRDLPNA